MKIGIIKQILALNDIDIEDKSTLQDFSLEIENDPWLSLHFESEGVGPNGMPAFSMSHYRDQDHAHILAPKIWFEVAVGEFFPYAIQNVFGHSEVYVLNAAGKVDGGNMTELRDLNSFCRMWAKNIKQQGFLKAAKSRETQPA